MINLSRHIEYELLYHDTVVVPQLGTFKATYVPSKWIEDEEILLPPYRALSFTQEVDESDTRFVEAISTSYQISTEEAYIVTLEFTENIQQELIEYGSYELGSIGEFVQEETTGKLRFIPCQAGAASPWLYGLDAIHVHPHKKGVLATSMQEDKSKHDNTDAKKITFSINRRMLHYVTTIAASIVLFFAFSTPVAENSRTKNQEMSTEFLLPSTLISASQSEATQPELNTEVAASETKKEAKVTNTKATTEQQQTETEKADGSFAVVLCCGVPAQNAEAYCQDLNARGIKAVVDNSGRFLRVLIPGFTSREEALTKVRSLRSISKEFSNAWIMEKK